MKKTIALLLALLMVLGLAACGGSKDDSSSGKKDKTSTETPDAPDETPTEPEKKVYDAVGAMRFDMPEGFTSLERNTQQDLKGKIEQAYFTFSFSDAESISYAYAKGLDLKSKAEQQGLESEEINGVTYYYMEDGVEFYAYTQLGEDVYGVQCVVTDAEKGKTVLKDALSAVRWEEDLVLDALDTDLYDVKYTVDPALKLAGYSITVAENEEGEVQKKSVIWKYGEDLSSPDFNLMIRVYKNDTLANVTKSEKEYEEKTVGDITYTVLKPEEGKSPIEYYVQHGDDVYELRNNGQDLGWFVSRSDECVAAFDAFVNSVSFK